MTWTDVAGGNSNAVGEGIFTECLTGANGAAGRICELRGTVDSLLDFGASALPDVFTMCTVTRYAGYFQNQIIKGSDFLHGHDRGNTGVAYYWENMTNWNNKFLAVNTDWLIFCGQNAAPWHFLANGQSVGTLGSGPKPAGGIQIGVNICPGPGWDRGPSDFGITEIAIWNRTLSQDELSSMSRYYSDMLANGNLGSLRRKHCFGILASSILASSILFWYSCK